MREGLIKILSGMAEEPVKTQEKLEEYINQIISEAKQEAIKSISTNKNKQK